MDLFDIRHLNESLAQSMVDGLDDEISRNQFVLGDSVLSFERKFASYNKADHCVGVNSGLDALTLALEYIKNQTHKRDIIVQGHSYFATFSSIYSAGFRLIAVDPCESSHNLDLSQVEQVMDDNVAAIMNVRLYGRMGPSADLLRICEENDIFLIEDCAQSHGITLHSEDLFRSPRYFQAYSFYPTKNLGALGDGGAIVTNNADAAEFLQMYRDYGRTGKFTHAIPGANSRLDTVQARVLEIKLATLDRVNEKRRQSARFYQKHLDPEKLGPSFDAFKVEDEAFAPHLMPIFIPDKTAAMQTLTDAGIPFGQHYPYAVSDFKQMFDNQLVEYSSKISRSMAEQEISLPHGSHLSEDQIVEICKVVNAL